MRYRQMGGTDLRLSEIGFGTGDNGGLMVRGSPDERIRAVARAMELGINHFDTAPMYGRGLAEIHLGEALRAVGEPAIITTKAGLMPADLDDVAGFVMRSCEESLRRLGTDQVDVLQVHNPPCAAHDRGIQQWTPVTVADLLAEGGALEAMVKLRDQGKVRYLGFTCELAEPEPVKRLLDTGQFHLVNVWFNLLNPSAGHPLPRGLELSEDYGRIIDYAAEHGVGTAVFRPLAGGVLSRQADGSEARHPYARGSLSTDRALYRAELQRARALSFLAQDDRRTLVQAAYRFVLIHPGVTTATGGFSSLEQIEEAAAWESGEPFSADELARVGIVWAENFGLPTALPKSSAARVAPAQ